MSLTLANNTDNTNNMNDDFELEHPIVVLFILGGPGAGKGTQCAKLVEKYSNIVTLSTGQLLRQLKKSGTPEGNRIAAQMAEGKLVDINATERLLKPEFIKHQRRRIEENNNNNNNNILFIIDGFPRDLSILKDWQNGMSNDAIVPFMIEFVCDSEIMKQRLMKRSNNEKVKRNDNNVKAIENRIGIFENETQKVISEFKRMDNKYKAIDASMNEERVFESLCEMIEPVLNNMDQLIKDSGLGNTTDALNESIKDISLENKEDTDDDDDDNSDTNTNTETETDNENSDSNELMTPSLSTTRTRASISSIKTSLSLIDITNDNENVNVNVNVNVEAALILTEKNNTHLKPSSMHVIL